MKLNIYHINHHFIYHFALFVRAVQLLKITVELLLLYTPLVAFDFYFFISFVYPFAEDVLEPDKNPEFTDEDPDVKG